MKKCYILHNGLLWDKAEWEFVRFWLDNEIVTIESELVGKFDFCQEEKPMLTREQLEEDKL